MVCKKEGCKKQKELEVPAGVPVLQGTTSEDAILKSKSVKPPKELDCFVLDEIVEGLNGNDSTAQLRGGPIFVPKNKGVAHIQQFGREKDELEERGKNTMFAVSAGVRGSFYITPAIAEAAATGNDFVSTSGAFSVSGMWGKDGLLHLQSKRDYIVLTKDEVNRLNATLSPLVDGTYDLAEPTSPLHNTVSFENHSHDEERVLKPSRRGDESVHGFPLSPDEFFHIPYPEAYGIRTRKGKALVQLQKFKNHKLTETVYVELGLVLAASNGESKKIPFSQNGFYVSQINEDDTISFLEREEFEHDCDEYCDEDCPYQNGVREHGVTLTPEALVWANKYFSDFLDRVSKE